MDPRAPLGNKTFPFIIAAANIKIIAIAIMNVMDSSSSQNQVW